MEERKIEKDVQAPYAYFMDRVFGIGNKAATVLLSEYGTPRLAYQASQKEVAGLLDERRALAWKTLKDRWDVQGEYETLAQRGIRFVSRLDAAYPQRLREIPDQPFALYVLGRLPADGIPSVAVVGARNCSPYGKHVAEEVGRGLAEAGVQVVSGMALGIDGTGQQAALSAGGQSFAVLGCGVDICYPSRHRQLYEELQKSGGVISTYPPGTLAKPELFPPRNRIISGLADAVVVVEARQKSGTLITVDMALEQGREVYCVPGRITDSLSAGCNRLIGQGADVVLSVQDLLEKLEVRRENSAEDTGKRNSGERLSGRERILWELLDYDPVSIEQLHMQLAVCPGIEEITLQEVMALLGELVLKGRAENISGSYYVKKG